MDWDTSILWGRPAERFFRQVGEPPDMVGSGIDRGLNEVANLHIAGQPLGHLAKPLFVRCHRELPGFSKTVASRERQDRRWTRWPSCTNAPLEQFSKSRR